MRHLVSAAHTALIREDEAARATLPAPPDKICACGRTHDAFEWARLPLVGEMDDGDGGVLELKNCGCGSTLAVEVPRAREAA